MANPTTFYGRRIYFSPDGKNLNRVYPGRADGTLSQRIAHAITSEVIARATHVIDMHCGDGNESLRPYSYWQVTGDRVLDEAGKQLALAFGLDHIVIDRERPSDPERTLYTSNTAVRRGKPAITVESGGMGLTDEASVGAQEAGALSVMAELGMLAAPSVKVERPLWIDKAAGRHLASHGRVGPCGREDAERRRGDAPRARAGSVRQPAARGARAVRGRSAVRGRDAAGERRRAARLRGASERGRAEALGRRNGTPGQQSHVRNDKIGTGTNNQGNGLSGLGRGAQRPPCPR